MEEGADRAVHERDYEGDRVKSGTKNRRCLMRDCVKKDVCRHLIALDGNLEACAATETCRFILEAVESKKEKPATRTYKKKGEATKRHYKKRTESAPPLHEPIDDDSGITEKQFKKAKKKIINARQNKGLNENQERALESMKGLHFKSLNGTQKQQILNIAKDL